MSRNQQFAKWLLIGLVTFIIGYSIGSYIHYEYTSFIRNQSLMMKRCIGCWELSERPSKITVDEIGKIVE